MVKLIVSYDGTDNDRDALALGRLLSDAGASLELAYVRHAHEAESGRERLAESEAVALLAAEGELTAHEAQQLIELRAASFASDDMREGLRAFAEKRPPVWRGR